MASEKIDPDELYRAENGLCIIEFIQNAPRTAMATGTVAGFAFEQAQVYISGGFAKPWHPPKVETGKSGNATRTI